MTAGLPLLVTEVCGYASYITAAQAGKVLASPFSQAAMNHALQEMLENLTTQPWATNAKAFVQQMAATQVSYPEARVIAATPPGGSRA